MGRKHAEGKHHSKGWICIKHCKSQYEKLIFQKSKKLKITKNYEKLLKKSIKKQGLKIEGFQDQFSSMLDGFGMDFRVKLGPGPLPERGRFF